MNKQIELLARQAGAAVQPGGELLFVGNTSIEKFAQLIVRECAGILMTPEYPMNHPEELGDYNRGWVNGRLLSIEHIKEHFGVEL